MCIKQNGEIEKPWIWDVGAISKNLAFCCSASSSWSSSWWAVKSTQPKNPKIYAIKVMLTGCCHLPTTLRHCETLPQGQPQKPQRFWNRRPSQPCPINKLSSRKSSLLSVEKNMKSLRKILGICWDNHGCVFFYWKKKPEHRKMLMTFQTFWNMQHDSNRFLAAIIHYHPLSSRQLSCVAASMTSPRLKATLSKALLTAGPDLRKNGICDEKFVMGLFFGKVRSCFKVRLNVVKKHVSCTQPTTNTRLNG